MTHTGHLKFFHANKGYGIIVRDGDRADVFVHATAPREPKFWRRLGKGGRIVFELGTSRNGKPCAVNLRVEEMAK